jgi:hypothetical protein
MGRVGFSRAQSWVQSLAPIAGLRTRPSSRRRPCSNPTTTRSGPTCVRSSPPSSPRSWRGVSSHPGARLPHRLGHRRPAAVTKARLGAVIALAARAGAGDVRHFGPIIPWATSGSTVAASASGGHSPSGSSFAYGRRHRPSPGDDGQREICPCGCATTSLVTGAARLVYG